VLYARCAFCGAIVPLYCSGRFMPHMPVPVVATPMGATCSTCGVLPPVFTCGFCWGQQLLYLPGASAAPQMGQNYAAVVQAQPGASDSALKGLFKEFGKGVGGELVKGLTQAMSGQQQY
jgi:hypothetical protein